MEKGVVNQIQEEVDESKKSSSSFLVYHRRINPKTFQNLPEELVIEILKRLPVTSLLRFMCVCKSWYSLITNPSFISVHLSIQSNKISSNCSSTLYSFGFEFFLHDVDEPLNDWTKIDSLVGHKQRLIVGNFDGVLCLFDHCDRGVGPLILWNPSIRKAFTLPLPIPAFRAKKFTFADVDPRQNVIFGFGFDFISKDYKVVRVFYEWDVKRQITCFHADVCSLSKDNWRFVGFSAEGGKFAIEQRGVCVNGVIHWLCKLIVANIVVYKTVLTFNLVSEDFGQIVLPNPLSSAALFSIKLGEDNKLAVSCTGDGSNIWVMEEYGVVKSWRKLLDFHLGDNVGMLLGATVRRDGKIVVTTSVGNSISWDPRNHKLKNVALPALEPDYVDNFVRSLVLLRFENRALHCKKLPLRRTRIRD
ncbi:hypothetical protein RDABS01_020545 [Bienertia sinuspersici]